jgi:acylphosphatase
MSRGNNIKRVEISVIGRVQGVCFRYYTCETARSLKLNGFVQNLPDGTVIIRAEGEESSLHELVRWAEHGPPGAIVKTIHVNFIQSPNEFTDFTIRY